MKMGDIGEPCYAARCVQDASHILTMRVRGKPNIQSEIAYCLKDALYFAAWLPYCYPGEQELISITPPASELFNR